MQDATKEQIKIVLGTGHLSDNFVTNMKRCLIKVLQDREDASVVVSFKEQVKTFLDSNFPNHKITRGCERGKPYITFWLEGHPNG